MRVWRISKAEFAETAFSGLGGFLASARWHHRGHYIVYTAQSLSLGSFEVWVNFDPSKPLPAHVSVSADVPDDLHIHHIDERSLPRDWDSPKLLPVLQDLRTEWLVSGGTAVARVFGAVFGEVEGGVFEDGDEVGEFLDFVGANARVCWSR
jgi:RES domain-containing protein